MDSFVFNLKDVFLLSISSAVTQFFLIVLFSDSAIDGMTSFLFLITRIAQWHLICQCTYLLHSSAVTRRFLIFFFEIYLPKDEDQAVRCWLQVQLMNQWILKNQIAYWADQIISVIASSILSVIACCGLLSLLSFLLNDLCFFGKDVQAFFLRPFFDYPYNVVYLCAGIYLNLCVSLRYFEQHIHLSFDYFTQFFLNAAQKRKLPLDAQKMFSGIHFLSQHYPNFSIRKSCILTFVLLQSTIFLIFSAWHSRMAFLVNPCLLALSWLILYGYYICAAKKQHLTVLKQVQYLKKIL